MRRWLWPAAGLATTIAWAVAATYDQPRERTAAAAAAALVTATVTPRAIESTLTAVVLLGLFPLAMTRTGFLAAAVVLVAAVELAVDRRVERVANLVGAGLVALTGLPSLAGALLLLAGPSPVLMIPALLTATGADLPTPETAIACALAAVALAAFDRPGPAGAALGIVGSPLLLAGALVRHRLAAVALLPGAVALTTTLSSERLTAANAALAAGLLGTAALTAWRRAPSTPATPNDLPSVVLLAWLAVLPSTWRWAGQHDLTQYERGVAVALATAGMAVVATSLRRPRHGTTSSTS